MFFVGPIRDLFSQLKKKKTNIRTSKFRQISKSPDDIHTTQILTDQKFHDTVTAI